MVFGAVVLGVLLGNVAVVARCLAGGDGSEVRPGLLVVYGISALAAPVAAVMGDREVPEAVWGLLS